MFSHSSAAAVAAAAITVERSNESNLVNSGAGQTKKNYALRPIAHTQKSDFVGFFSVPVRCNGQIAILLTNHFFNETSIIRQLKAFALIMLYILFIDLNV